MTTEVAERVEEEIEIKMPGLWRVIFHNDDRTTMDFVVFLLRRVFYKTTQESVDIMLTVHEKGYAMIGVYTHEIAENKMNICLRNANEQGFPFNVTIEEDV